MMMMIVNQTQKNSAVQTFCLCVVKGAMSQYFESFLSVSALIAVQVVGKPKNNGLLRKKNTKGLILKQKGTRMAEDDGFEKFSHFFQNTRMMT